MKPSNRHYWFIILAALVLLGLGLVSRQNYLLFHAIAEIFSIVVACCIFVVAWNSRHTEEDGYLLLIGVAYLFVAAMDGLHTLAYQDMGVFHPGGSNLATQLWIAARYIESVSLLLAPLLVGRKLRASLVFAGYAIVLCALLLSIFKWPVFPACYLEETGLTPFKKVSEYIIILFLLISAGLFLRRRRDLEFNVLHLVIASLAVTCASELAFTFYRDVTGIANLTGHYLKIVSFYLIYRAVVRKGLLQPTELLFRDLKHREEALSDARDQWVRTFDAVPDCIFILDNDSRIVRANKVVADRLGCAIEDIVGRHCYDVIHGTDTHVHCCPHVQLLADGLEHKTEQYENNLGGWFSISVTPLRDANGEIVGAVHVARDITEQRHFEEILKTEKEFTETAFNAQTDTLFVFEPTTGKAVRWNEAFKNLSGYSDEEIRSMKSPDSYYSPDDLKRAAEAAEKILSGGTVTIQMALITKDGRSIPTEYTGSAIKDQQGNVRYIIAAGRDITERHLAEQALRESEAKYRTLVEQMPAITYLAGLDQTSSTLYISPQIKELLGRTQDEYHSNPAIWNETIHPEDRMRVMDERARAISDGEPFNAEYRMITRDGRTKWFRDEAVIVYGPSGRPLCLQGVILDITERQLAEQALKQSETRFRTLVEGLGQGYVVFMHDLDGTVTYVSPSIEALTGAKPEQVIGRPWQHYVRWTKQGIDAGRQWGRRIRETARPSEPFVMSYEFDGRTHYIEVAERPTLDDAGNVIGIEGIAKDVTDQVLATEALQKAHDELELRVRQRTEELQKRLIFERLMFHLSERFVDLPGDRIEQEMAAALEDVVEFFDVEQGFILQVSNDRTRMSLLHSYITEGSVPDADIDVANMFPYAWPKFLEGQAVGFSSIDQLPEAAAVDRESFAGLDAKSHVAVPVRIGGEPTYVFSLGSIQEERQWDKDVISRIQLVGELLAGALRRKGAEQDLRDSYVRISQLSENLRVRLDFESLVSELSARFVSMSPDSVDKEIEHALLRIAEFYDVDRCLLWKVRPGKDAVKITHMAVRDGIELPTADLNAIELFPWCIETVLSEGRPVSINMIDDLPSQAAKDRQNYLKWGTQSVLVIPVFVKDTIEHIISIASVTRQRTWPEEYIPRLRLLGETFANALGRKWAQEQIAKSREALRTLAGRLLNAQEDQRRRLARELHDDLTQRLAVLAIDISVVSRQLPPASDTIRDKLERMRTETVKLSTDVHAISRQLHPSILDDLGLVDAMRSECSTQSERGGIRISFEGGNLTHEVPREAAICLYRVLQEALRNAAKHARAANVYVSISEQPPYAVLCIKDDGVGFDLQQSHHRVGIGLASMEERVRLINGEFSVESTPGRGTIIKARAPLNKETE